MVVELKPCPFCGSKSTIEQNNSTKKWWICCTNTRCRINPSTDPHINRGVVVREWNRRVEQ